MSVITFSREIGSEGTYIVRQVAQALNYRLIDKVMLERILIQFGFVRFQQDYETASSYWDRMDESRLTMVGMLNRIFQAAASLGNVVVLGRGSFAVLGGYANVLNVRLQAPLAVRVQRVMAERNLAETKQAEEIVKESDQVRSSFVQSWYGLRWDVADYFNLVIDTSVIDRDTVVAWILHAQKAIEQAPAGDKRPLDSLVVDDTVLLRTVQETLESRPV